MEQNLRTPLAAFLCAIALGSAQAQTLSDNLIAHFPMDGSADDVIGGLIPTDTSGAPAFCPDRFGYANSAACFDGTGVWSFGDVLDLDTADFTIALWCRVESLTAGSPHHDYPLAKGTTAFGNPQHSGYAIGFRDELPDTLSTAFLRRDENDDLQLTSAPTSFSTWRHILVNRCDTLLSLILDGTLVDVDTLSADLDFATNTYFSIGASDRSPNGSITGYFNGAVDDIRIYKGRCLSQAEIDTLAYDLLTVGVPSTEESLVLRMSPNPARDRKSVV